MKYELKIPLQKIALYFHDPFGHNVSKYWNYALGMMTESFVEKYGEFPLSFNPCSHSQKVEGQYMVIRFSEEGITT